jgi:putative DNA primase/helicase
MRPTPRQSLAVGEPARLERDRPRAADSPTIRADPDAPTAHSSARIVDTPTQRCRAALAYAGRGWPVLPLHALDRLGHCTCRDGSGCTSPGKHPRTTHGLVDATVDGEQIRNWWRRWPNSNVGVVTGPRSGIIALDVDPRHGGDAALAELEATLGTLPRTVEARTGSGGRHLLFCSPEDREVRNSAGVLGTGIDVRGRGGFIVAPPSAHASGARYTWRAGCSPDDTRIAIAPEWLVARLISNRRAVTVSALMPEVIPDHQRSAALMSMGGTMRRRGFSSPAIYAALAVENLSRCHPPLPDREVRSIVASLDRYPPAPVVESGEGSGRGGGDAGAAGTTLGQRTSHIQAPRTPGAVIPASAAVHSRPRKGPGRT